MTENNRLGPKIRMLRESKKMSVEELAEASRLRAELIEQLEAGALVPSLTPLLAISRALGVRLGTFVDDQPQAGPVVSRSSELGKDKDKVVRFSGKSAEGKSSVLDYYPLASDKQDRHMEPYIIDMHPQKENHELSAHEGEEFIYVMAGEVELFYGTEKFRISQGDSIYYDSVVPHDLHVYGDKDAKILAVIYTPL
ncbi:helix-turn-helix transcriptional regulator [Methanosarcinaceae archaeon]|nr:helix-turn-helix transcriptional regulator [Methanosarcinaceae archaeon]